MTQEQIIKLLSDYLTDPPYARVEVRYEKPESERHYPTEGAYLSVRLPDRTKFNIKIEML